MTTQLTTYADIPALLDQLETIYDRSVANLRGALTRYVTEGVRPDLAERRSGLFAYPELRVDYDPEAPPSTPARAFARLNQPGTYATSVARPALFRAYLTEQLEHLVRDYPVSVSVDRSASEIP